MGANDLQRIIKLLPNDNCSLCNAPSCATLARRIAVGKVDPEACVMIDPNNLKRIREIITEGIETSKEVTQVEPFVELQPCAEYGRVTLEAQLPKPEGSVYDLFDSCTMCTAFSDISNLDGIRCSLELGYGLAQLEDKRIHVFRSGKVTMRRAYDRRDAYETLAMISWSLWPSVICSCGCTVQECVSCACPDCRERLCPGIEWGVRGIEHTERPLGEMVREMLSSVEEDKAPPEVIEAVEGYRKGLSLIVQHGALLKKVDESLRAKDYDKVEAIGKEYHDRHMELAKLSIQLIVNSKGGGRVLGLVLNGAEGNLKNLGRGMFAVRTAGLDPLYNVAFEYALRGIRFFIDLDDDGARKMLEDCKFLRDKWKDRPYTSDSEFIYKMATYGCHFAMMLMRPMPFWTTESEGKAGPTMAPAGDERCET